MTIPDSTKKIKNQYSKKNPYPAKLLSCQQLNKTGSTKEILHVVLDLDDSGIEYQAGASFAIYPHNAPKYVSEILDILQINPNVTIYDNHWNDELPLIESITKRLNLAKITSKHLQLVYQDKLIEDKEKLLEFINNNNLRTFLSQHWNPSIQIQDLCNISLPLMPRYYSVASTMKKSRNQIHLLVAAFNYNDAGQMKHSITAEYLRDICKEGESHVSLFMQPAPNFTLPKDPSKPIIMIGPGVGLAPLKGFIDERIITKAKGKNWLFTGDRHEKFDFYFEDEFKELQKQGHLKLTTTFSRDGTEKMYVQHKMLEHQKELWSWITNDNAIIYICGNAKQMAKDVQQALVSIAINQGGLSEKEANDFIKHFRHIKRLQLDIY